MSEPRYYILGRRLARVTVRQIAHAYYSGEPLSSIAEQFDVCTRWPSKLLRRRGYPIRPKNFSRFPHIREAWLSSPNIMVLRERFSNARSHNR